MINVTVTAEDEGTKGEYYANRVCIDQDSYAYSLCAGTMKGQDLSERDRNEVAIRLLGAAMMEHVLAKPFVTRWDEIAINKIEEAVMFAVKAVFQSKG